MYCSGDVKSVEMTYSQLIFLKPVRKIRNNVLYSIYLRLICPAVLGIHCIKYAQLEFNGELAFVFPIVPSPEVSSCK